MRLCKESYLNVKVNFCLMPTFSILAYFLFSGCVLLNSFFLSSLWFWMYLCISFLFVVTSWVVMVVGPRNSSQMVWVSALCVGVEWPWAEEFCLNGSNVRPLNWDMVKGPGVFVRFGRAYVLIIEMWPRDEEFYSSWLNVRLLSWDVAKGRGVFVRAGRAYILLIEIWRRAEEFCSSWSNVRLLRWDVAKLRGVFSSWSNVHLNWET